jgi:polysaccharide export outer membrane protein
MVYFCLLKNVSIYLRYIFKPRFYLNTALAARHFKNIYPGIIFSVLAVVFLDILASAQTTPTSQASPPLNSSTFPVTSPSNTSPNTGTYIPSTIAPSADQSRYIISPGDVLDVSIFGAPDLSQKASVNSEGNIYMALINYVHVAGMHVEDAQGAVENAYLSAQVLKSPHVNIVITNYSSGVVLMGEVARQGIFPIVGSGKLFDILTEAGGVTANAGQVVTITHKDSMEPQTVMLTNDPVKSLAADVPVQQGDKIIVSKAGVIYVVGEVYGPSGFMMDEKDQYTVMKAIAMAHGTTKLAKTSKARIVRRTPNGNIEIPVPLDKILLSKAPDIPMQSNDILFVPTNKGKQAAIRTGDVAISLATGLTIIAAERL